MVANSSLLKTAIKTIKKTNAKTEIIDQDSLYYKIKLEFTLIKTYLQLAVSYSQFSEHKKALSCGRKCLFYFTTLCNNIKNIFIDDGTLFNFSFNKTTKLNSDKQDQKDLEKAFLNILDVILNINDFIERNLTYFEQNNIEHINQLSSNDLDSISFDFLCKKFNPTWLSGISITNFLHSEYVSLKNIDHTITFDEMYTEAFLSLIIMLSSTIYFMVATENRFICLETFSNENTQAGFKIKPVFEKTNFQKIRKTKKFGFR